MSTYTPPTVHFMFCDDIREEVNGQYSLMGVYTNTVLLEPTVTKHNFQAALYITVQEDSEGILLFDFSGYLNDQPIFNHSLGEVDFFDWQDSDKTETQNLVTYRLNITMVGIPVTEQPTFQIKALLLLDNGKQLHYDSHVLQFKHKPQANSTITVKTKTRKRRPDES